MSILKESWVITDPNNNQYGRQISKKVFEFKEDVFTDEGAVLYTTQEIIDLDKYSYEQIENIVSAYYKDLEEIMIAYGKEWRWILAECIFEQEFMSEKY